ncbi:hypothetical protein EJ08DRAFT_14866 [Tothia fuscella]|uniref:Acetyltransferase n=1 Tax=Tothia fuscella TaxID=1048955 RepID=A0A9P4P2M1_9PEZI|nr:hypothetical protein EJ08DRAFT_14866 [Tothia fuscella]
MLSLGRVLLSIQPILISVGSFAADFNETHVYNPRWPPHARFHNGQTMSMAATLSAACLYYTWRSTSLPAAPAKKESIFAAALFGSIYCFTGLTAILYPGALGTDPEFGTGFPQGSLFSILLVVNWAGWWLENRKINAGMVAKQA